RAQHQLALALIDAAARHLYVLRDQGLLDLRDGQVIRLKLLGIHPDVDLALAVAYKTHLADAADGLYLLFYFLVRDLGDLAGATSGRDRNRHDGGRVGIELLDNRRINILGQVTQNRAHLVTHVLGGLLHVAFEHEGNEDL